MLTAPCGARRAQWAACKDAPMDTIKNLIIYAVLIVLLWAAVVVIRRYAVRVQVPADYVEVQIPDVEHYPTYALSRIPFSAYSHGDAVAYRTPENSQHGTAFGWVLALPGDTVSISDGTLSVNGKPDSRFTNLGRPDLPPCRSRPTSPSSSPPPTSPTPWCADRCRRWRSRGAWRTSREQAVSKKELLGIGMMALAGILVLVALLVGWRTIVRCMAINSLDTALAAMGDVADAERSARMVKEAAADLPKEAAAVLPSLDLADPAVKDRLDRLSALCDPDQRPLIDDARAYGEVLRSEVTNLSAEGDDADLALLAAVVQMRNTNAPVDARLAEHAVPHLPVLMLYESQLLTSALATRNAAGIASAASAEAILMPSHAEFLLANLTAMALAAKLDFNTMGHYRDLCPQKTRVAELLLELGDLVPEHRQQLLAIGLAIAADAPLDMVARNLAQAANEGRVDMGRAVQALLALNQPELALPLVSKLPQGQQETLARALHNRIGDTAALATLGAGDATIMPRCTLPQVHHGIICFHVSNLQGCLPRTGVTVHLDGVAIDAKKIHRIGTLFGVRPDAARQAKIEVFAGAQSIYSGTVGP